MTIPEFRDDLPDRSDEYLARDLLAEGEWPHAPHACYGGVIFNGRGEVFLREPKNHFGGYHWTFPKGRPDMGEMPIETAVRETLEETGHRPKVVGHVPGVFGGSTSSSYFFLMMDTREETDATAMNDETSDLRWVTPDDAVELIAQTTLATGRTRDLHILKAACKAMAQLQGA